MNFSEYYFESVVSDFAEKNPMFPLIEEVKLGNYLIFLMGQPMVDMPSLGITSGDRPAFTPHDQRAMPSLETKIDWNIFKQMMVILKDWVKKYGEIMVGSMNTEKTEKYKKILTRMGFKIKSFEDHFGVGLIPDEYGFIITNE
jgi:hypothetical protein